jgi:hypothetical protein
MGAGDVTLLGRLVAAAKQKDQSPSTLHE